MKTKLYLSSINRCYNISYIENELNKINNIINLFERLLNEQNIDFYEYIDIINKLYYVQITENDLIRISSCLLGSDCKYAIINTNIICELTKSNLIGNTFEYLEEEHNFYLKIAFTDGITDFKHKYTYKEIVNLSNEHKIIILDFVFNVEDDSYLLPSEYGSLSTLKKYISSLTCFKYLKDKDICSVYSFLRSIFCSEKIYNDFCFYMNDIKIKLSSIEKYISNLKLENSIDNIRKNNIYVTCDKIKKRKISKN